MSKLVFGITKLVTKREETFGNLDIGMERFLEARDELRRACPEGNVLHIHLYYEADSAQEVGATFAAEQQWVCPHCGRAYDKRFNDWEITVADHIDSCRER